MIDNISSDGASATITTAREERSDGRAVDTNDDDDWALAKEEESGGDW